MLWSLINFYSIKFFSLGYRRITITRQSQKTELTGRWIFPNHYTQVKIPYPKAEYSCPFYLNSTSDRRVEGKLGFAFNMDKE